MAGDYSKFSFDPGKGFASVLQQQGRVSLDSDWNETEAISERRRRTDSLDTFGFCVVSGTTPDAFLATPTGIGDFSIGIGRAYVDGYQVECRGTDPLAFDATLSELVGTTPLDYATQQPFLPTPLPTPPAGDAGTSDLVYLDVWQREVTFLEDGDLLEVALGGPDTTTRLQTVWQVRVLANVGDVTCADPVAAYDAATRPSAARLTTSAVAPPDPDDPCIIPPTGGYRGLENRLYRVEVHMPGPLGTARFKWSREAGSICFGVESLAAGSDSVILRSLGRDQHSLSVEPGNWIEILDDRIELALGAGHIAKVAAVDPATREVSFLPAVPGGVDLDPTDDARHTRVRRWDQTPVPDGDGLLGVGAGPIELEAGVRVEFSLDPAIAGGEFRAGDYWLFWARTATASVELLDEAPPRGIHHHYCRLAVIHWGDSLDTTDVDDCRTHWPPLGGCCTIIVRPGEDIQAAIDALPLEGGCVCLKTGVHEIDETLRIERSDVLIHGESPGTRVLGTVLPLLSIGVLAPRPARIQVRDIRFEALAEAGGAGMPTVLALVSCDDVEIDGCGVSAQGGQASGITLWDTDRISIVGCDIDVSLNGIWVIEDSLALRVRNNRIQAPRSAQGADAGGVGIFAEMQFAPCVVENNHVEGFQVGIALTREPFSGSGFSGADGSDVLGNHVTRFATTEAGDDIRLYGIDVAADDCRICGNTLVYASSRYGGIRATGSRIGVDKNRITSLFPSLDAAQFPVGVRVGMDSVDLAADDVRIRDNTIAGVQDAVVVLGGAGVVVADNHIAAPNRGLRTGILFDGVSSGNAERNHISDARTAIQFSDGERNQALGNHLERGGTGILVDQESSVEIANNQFRETGEIAIQISSWLGTARLHHNRCRACGHELSIASASIFALMGLGELQVESCDIRDTGLSPLDNSVVSPGFGIFGFLVIQASVQSNNIGSALAALDVSGDPANMPVQRAVYLLGLLDLQLNDILGLGFPAQILDNRFSGIGTQPVVEIAALQANDLLWIRFNRVQYSDNFCWHLNPPQDGGATVRIAAATASAMGNHFKSLAFISPVDFGSTSAIYIGNAAQGAQALGSSILPSPQNAFNR